MIKRLLPIVVAFASAVPTLAAPSIYDLEILRQYSKFVEFEKYFNVDKVHSKYRCDNHGRGTAFYRRSEKPYSYTIWAVPKKQNPLRKLSLNKVLFDFREVKEDYSFGEEYSSGLCEGLYAAIHKNLSFKKWLKRAAQKQRNSLAGIEYEDEIYYQFRFSHDVTKNEIFRIVGISGAYVGTLKYGSESVLRYSNWCGGGLDYGLLGSYEFWISDIGDVLVASTRMSWGDKTFFDSVFTRRASIKECKEPKKIIPFDCYYSIISSEHCQDSFPKNAVPYRVPQYCDYIIVRKDGTIEYGPKSGRW